jgi:hypothetical protein
LAWTGKDKKKKEKKKETPQPFSLLISDWALLVDHQEDRPRFARGNDDLSLCPSSRSDLVSEWEGALASMPEYPSEDFTFLNGTVGEEFNGGAGFLVEAEYGYTAGILPNHSTTAPKVWCVIYSIQDRTGQVVYSTEFANRQPRHRQMTTIVPVH